MLWIPIDRKRDVPFFRQVFTQIQTSILRGDLRSGDRLPSTRELAEELQVSRNVILEAYEQLMAEGYIVARHGSGTYVAEGTYLEQADSVKVDRALQRKAPAIHKPEPTESTNIIDFRSGIPDLTLFPRSTWAKLSYEVCHEITHTIFSYGNPEGCPELRETLSRYLVKTRGVHCHPDQFVITSGATQAFNLVAKLLLSTNDQVIMEDPITNGIQTIFTSTGALLHPIPVDEQGMMTELLPATGTPKFVFVTPSHQFPLGGTLPIQRRNQLINFARSTDCYLVEDDYDSEFRYEGVPVSSLQGLDPERVIYIGSYSKILSPALRLGYLILPIELIERCRNLKWYSDVHTSSLNQMILSRFIERGYLERHILKMKKVYKKRRDQLMSLLKQNFSDQVRVFGHSTGLHLIAEFQNLVFTEDVLQKVLQAGVRVYPVENHTIQKGTHQNRVILGYGHLREEELAEGVKRLRLSGLY